MLLICFIWMVTVFRAKAITVRNTGESIRPGEEYVTDDHSSYIYPKPVTTFQLNANQGTSHQAEKQNNILNGGEPINWKDPKQNPDFHSVIGEDPLLSALLITTSLGLKQKPPGYNHPQHLPVNPYVALLLSHYGRYVPLFGMKYGIYGYNAANNYHNNKPYGAYKINEDFK